MAAAVSLTDKEIDDLRDVFSIFDVNKDGTIDIFELEQVMEKMHIHLSQRELLEMIRSVDADRSGSIDFDEFVMLMQSRVGQGGPDEHLRYAFLQFDRDGTGFISKENLRQTMIEFDNALTKEEIDAIFEEMDLDHDGQLTFREFRNLMKS